MSDNARISHCPPIHLNDTRMHTPNPAPVEVRRRGRAHFGHLLTGVVIVNGDIHHGEFPGAEIHADVVAEGDEGPALWAFCYVGVAVELGADGGTFACWVVRVLILVGGG